MEAKRKAAEEDEHVTQFFRTERMLQHRFKKSNDLRPKQMIDTSVEKRERRRVGGSRYNMKNLGVKILHNNESRDTEEGAKREDGDIGQEEGDSQQ